MNTFLQLFLVGILTKFSQQTNSSSPWIQADATWSNSNMKEYIQKTIEQNMAEIQTKCQQNTDDIKMYRDKISALEADVIDLKRENAGWKTFVNKLQKHNGQNSFNNMFETKECDKSTEKVIKQIFHAKSFNGVRNFDARITETNDSTSRKRTDADGISPGFSKPGKTKKSLNNHELRKRTNGKKSV